MSQDDWYRGTAWDAETRAVFEAKLGRARTSRSQYLRIKGLELTSSADAETRQAGRELLRRMLAEHPDDAIQVTMANADLAASLAGDGHLREAAEHYERSIAGHPNVDWGAELGLVEVILLAEWSDRYDEALDLLIGSTASADPFPAHRFRWNLAGARLASRQGDHEAAREFAERALRSLAETESPFPRHRELGLASADHKTEQELRRLASG